MPFKLFSIQQEKDSPLSIYGCVFYKNILAWNIMRFWLCWCIIELSWFRLPFAIWLYLHLLHYYWQIDVRTLEGCFYFWNVGVGGKVYQKWCQYALAWKTILQRKIRNFFNLYLLIIYIPYTRKHVKCER